MPRRWRCSTSRPVGTRVLVPGGSHAHYVPSGHLVYTAGGTLRAVPFDLARLETRGTPVTVLPRLVTTAAGGGRFRRGRRRDPRVRGRARSRSDGAHAGVGGSAGPGGAAGAPPRPYFHPRVSPDGTRVAVAITARRRHLGVGSRPPDVQPADVRFLAQLLRCGRRRASSALLLAGGRSVCSGRPPTAPARPSARRRASVRRDAGRQQVLFSSQGAVDMMMLALDGTHRVEPLLQTPSTERNGVVSPDGRWLAYESDSSGAIRDLRRAVSQRERGAHG